MKSFIIFFISSGLLFAHVKKEPKKYQLKLHAIRNGIVFKKEIKRDVKEIKEKKLFDKKGIIFYKDNQGNRFNSQSELMIKFKKPNKLYLRKIERIYGIKLVKQLLIGDYLFKNSGKENTVDIINRMIKREGSRLVRINPNKTLNFIKR